jgi:hypothetical protein
LVGGWLGWPTAKNHFRIKDESGKQESRKKATAEAVRRVPDSFAPRRGKSKCDTEDAERSESVVEIGISSFLLSNFSAL